MDDAGIVELYLLRDEDAIGQTSAKYGSRLRTLAHGIVLDQETAEECENDTYLEAWNSIPPHAPDPLAPYVCRIARNLAVNRYHAGRAEKRRGDYELVLDEMEACIPSGVDIETELEAKELSAAIDRFLSTLSREDRFLFVRRYWYADPVGELAAMTHSSANRVSVRLFRLREKLRITLTKEGFLA